jgi:phage-related minor tail protein
MFAFAGNSAFAFIFSDISALAQRVAKFSQDATQYVSENSHFAQFMSYVKEFNTYRNQFEGYQNKFNSIYRKIENGYYTNAFDVSKWDWTRLDDHLLKAWRSVNQALWDAQSLAVRTSRLYDTNPAYKRYADHVLKLSEEKLESIKKDEALSEELEKRGKDRRKAIEDLKATNKDLSGQEDSASHLQALNNQILLELAALQAEASEIERQRLRNTLDMDNLNRELERLAAEAQENEAQAWEWIFNTTNDQ